MRDIYLTEDPKVARVLLDKAIVGCQGDEVDEIRSLGATLERWRTEILNHHRTGVSNGPTEGLNLCVKKVKRTGRGSPASSTIDCGCFFTLVVSPGPGVHHRRGSEPALPTQTRRAGKAPITALCRRGAWLQALPGAATAYVNGRRSAS